MDNALNLADGVIERLPPQSIEAEQAILGALLVNPEIIGKVCDILQPDHFYRKAHQIIFAGVLDLFEKSEPIDIVTVSQYLKDQGKLDGVGGRQYLTDLALSIATTANAEWYAKTVQEKATLRNLIKAGTEIVSSCYEDSDTDLIVDKAEQLIFNIAQGRNTSALIPIKDIVNESFARIEKRYEQRDALSGLSTGFYDLDEMTSGWQKSDLIIIAARPSMGKCLAADSEIVLADGSVATIETLYKRGGGTLLTLDNSYKLKWTEPSMLVDDGIKPVFQVVTRLGRSIETTLCHPFLTMDGWKPLSALMVGDHIAVPRKIPVNGIGQARECEVKLLAYLIAGGDLTATRPRFTNANPQIRVDFEQAIEEFGGVTMSSDGITVNPLQRWLKEMGLAGCNAFEKHVPPFVFSLCNDQIAQFLNRLFACAGWASVYPSGQAQIGYATVSARLARQIQHLLLRFGIVARLKRKSVSYRGEKQQCWQLEITDQLSLSTFIEQIGIFGKEAAIAAVSTAILNRRYQTNADLIPVQVWSKLQSAKQEKSWEELARCAGLTDSSHPHVGKRSLSRGRLLKLAGSLGHSELMDRADSDVYWDQIVSIKYVGDKQVYDLTIPDTHNFIANDICVHNTALVLNLAQHAAVECKAPVAVFSLEMSKEQLVQRLLCAEARIDANKMRTGFLQQSDWSNLATAMGRLGEAPLFIDDSAVVTALDVRAKCRRLKAEMKGLGLVIIDYIQLMQGRARSDGNRVQEVSEISRGLKQLARELDCPVIALSQLSRAVEARQNKRPMLSDLRESGSIEQDADIVMFIYRDDYYNQESEKRGEAEIIIAKQRNGPVGTVELLYQASITRFLNKASTNQYVQV
jgi:replicative DNA helicase